MSRKKRTPEAAPAQSDNQEKTAHTDAFQKKGVEAVTGAVKALEGKGRTIAYAVGGVILVAIVVGIIFSVNNRADEAGQAALGRALKTAGAEINANPPAGSSAKTFKTEVDRARAAVAEFDAVAAEHGGAVREKAKYFSAAFKRVFEKEAAIAELETMSKGSGEVAALAKFALAQTKASDSKPDEALTLYRELLSMTGIPLSKDVINFEIAKILEGQGKKDEAVNVYFEIAKASNERKDPDGAAATPSQTAAEAKKRLERLSPEKAKEIPPPSPAVTSVP